MLCTWEMRDAGESMQANLCHKEEPPALPPPTCQVFAQLLQQRLDGNEVQHAREVETAMPRPPLNVKGHT